MLPQVKFDSIKPRVVKNNIDTSIYIQYSFKDPQGIDNWYVLNFYKLNKDTTAQKNSNPFGNDNNTIVAMELLSDKVFETSLYTQEKLLPGLKSTDTIGVMISNISEGYFKFLDAQKRAGGILSSIVGEPINFPTNVRSVTDVDVVE